MMIRLFWAGLLAGGLGLASLPAQATDPSACSALGREAAGVARQMRAGADRQSLYRQPESEHVPYNAMVDDVFTFVNSDMSPVDIGSRVNDRCCAGQFGI